MTRWVKKISGKWGYELLVPIAYYAPELKMPDCRICALKSGKLLMAYKRGYLCFYAGYAWDGCTGIGRLLETDGTLLASLVHDGCYHLAEQVSYKVPFTRADADRVFRRALPCWAKPIYWGAVRVFGAAFYGGNETDLEFKFS